MKFVFGIIILIIIAVLFWLFTSHTKIYPHSAHYDGRHFSNVNGTQVNKGLFALLKWKLTSKRQDWPEPLVKDNMTPDLSPLIAEQGLRITFINHASVLIQWQGVNIITDPALVDGIGPLGSGWIARYRAPGITFEQLPPIDYILISHNHYDHLDRPTIEKIIQRDGSKIITPLAVAQYTPAQNVLELDWWQSYKNSAQDLNITLVPAQHWSKRTLLDTNKSLWGGFIIQKNNQTVFFSGDTGYSEHFKMIAQRFPAIDVALLPIGAYLPRDFMKLAHTNPAEAVTAAQELNAKTAIGIHFGTFRLSDEGIDQPVIDLQAALKSQNRHEAFIAPKNGQSFYFK